MPSNEPDTTELPRYEDGATTIKLPVTVPESEEAVREPDRSGATVVVGSRLYRTDTTTVLQPSSATDTTELPALRPRLTFWRLMQPVTSSRLVKGLLASNILVLCVAIGLFAGGLWAANEAGVIPDSIKPGILKSDPKPSKAPTRKESPTSPAASKPSYWQPVVKPAATPSSKGVPSPKTSPSASISPSASVSASAQPEVSPSATQPASPETTASATTPSTSVPAPTGSSTESEPTSPASDTATPPTGGTASASPATADPTVTP